MNKKKITKRILLLSAVCIAALFVFTSCGANNTGITVNDGKWETAFPEVTTGEEEENEESDSEGKEGKSLELEEFAPLSFLSAESEDESTSETESVEKDTETADPEAADTETGDVAADAEGDEETGKALVDLKNEKNFLDQILCWIGFALNWITSVVPGNNYLVTLFVFAIVMELLFLPFGIKQHKNSIKQAMLKPREVAIRRKYAGRNDQATMQKVNQEIQELYQKENYNPLSGCLPMLVQLPALIVLYWVVINPMKYVLDISSDFMSFMFHYLKYTGNAVSSNGTIQLLNKITQLGSAEGAFEEGGIFAADTLSQWCGNGAEVSAQLQRIVDKPLNFNIGFLDLGQIPSWKFWEIGSDIGGWLLLLIPVLTFAVYFFSMRINRKLSFQPTQSADEKQQACSNTMMDVMMPLMSVYITFIVPAAIGVYWIFKSLLGVLKQFILSKAMPLPKFTEEDYKAAEKELAGKQPKKIQKSENAGKVRSLHHIDDEDYDEQGNYRPVKKEEPIETTAEEINDSKMSEGTSMKDESDKQQKKFSFRDLFKKDDKKDEK